MLQAWEGYVGVDLCCRHGKVMLVLTCLCVMQVQQDVAGMGRLCWCRPVSVSCRCKGMLQPWESYIGVDRVLCCAGTKGCCRHGKFTLVLTCLDVVQVQGDVADVGCGCRQAALLQPAGVHHWGLPGGQCQTGGGHFFTVQAGHCGNLSLCCIGSSLHCKGPIYTRKPPL